MKSLRLELSCMAVGVMAMMIFLTTGCQNFIKRGQSPEKLVAEIDLEDENTRYIGNETSVFGLSFAKIQGIGLVTGLNGAGEDSGPSWQRDHLMEELRSFKNIQNPKDLVASLDTAVVKVTGLVPPGAKKGDRFDIEIEVLENSETSSLKGGRLESTWLRPVAFLGRRIREGNIMGSAEGSIMVDALFETRQDKSNQTRGWVLGGGVISEERKIGLNVRSEYQGIKNVSGITNAINNRFTVINAEGRNGIATAKTDRVIELQIPETYRNNLGRLFQVLASMAYGEGPTERVNRIDLLERKLNDPNLAKQAALRLEAIGKDATPALKRALKSAEIEVRFQAAMALSYLGEADGLDVLAHCAEHEPAFRWHSLAALTSMSDVKAGMALSKLLHVASTEARYGAFCALKKRSPNDPLVRGQFLAKEFSLHVIPSSATPMLHLSRATSPEIVVFGEGQKLKDDLLFLQSGLTVKGIGDNQIEITKYFPEGGMVRKTTSTSVAEVVRELAAAGCGYSTLVEFFREAKQKSTLDSRLAVNALPRLGRERLSSDWSDNSEEESTTSTYASDDVPAMFGHADVEDRTLQRDDVALLDGKSNHNDDSGNNKPSFFGKLNQTFTKNKNDE